jgi:Methyltransferase domain
MQDRKLWTTIAAPLLLMLLTSAIANAQQTTMPPRTQDRPLQDRIDSMERAQRDEWQKPDQVVKALDLKNGDIVADIGAGSGYFSRRLAQAVAPGGKVYAVDVAADILAYLNERAGREGMHNITTVVSRPDDPMLPVNSFRRWKTPNQPPALTPAREGSPLTGVSARDSGRVHNRVLTAYPNIT